MSSPAQSSNTLPDNFRQYLNDAETLQCLPATELQSLHQRLESDVFNLVVMGEFKRGKSSVINALIGENVLPVGVIPLTAIATFLEYGETPAMQILFQDGNETQADVQTLWDFATEKGNPDNEKNVAEVHIRWPSPWLKLGVRLIDTPGIGSVHQHNSDVTYDMLPRSDAVLLVLSVDQPIGQVEQDFLNQIRDYAGRIFFLLNKVDMLTADELDESLAFVSRVVTETMGNPVTLFPISARLALAEQDNQSADQQEKSGFPAFTKALQHFLARDRDNALVTSLSRSLLRLLTQAKFSTELTLSSLSVPIEELRHKVNAFENKRDEMIQEGRDFSILLKAEVKHLADNDVTTDVEEVTPRISRKIDSKVVNHFNSVHHLPSHKMDESLRQCAIEAVRADWDRFRRDEDEKLEAAFQHICARFSGKINTTVDELYRFSSDLFAIPFDTVSTDTNWSVPSRFYYKFWEAPGSMRLMTTSLIHALPKLLGDRLILRNARIYARELANTQAGRVRYDFAQHLDKSMYTFEKEMRERLTVAVEHIEAAVNKGLKLAAGNAKEADAAEKRFTTRLQALNTLVEKIKTSITKENGKL